MTPLILASTSTYRKALLARLGVPFSCEAPGVEEAAFQADTSDPVTVVRSLSRAKAEAVASRHRGAVVIGSDQVAEIDGRVLGKPGTEDAAVAQLQLLAGRTHRLLTGLAVIGPDGGCWIEHDETRLTMQPWSADELRGYVRRDLPLDCAGSYKFEAAGAGLFASVETRDPSAIEGLSLCAVSKQLRRLGFVPACGPLG